MKENPYLKAAILEVVEKQLQANDPPETKQTYDRLIVAGYSDKETRRMIGRVVVTEIYDIMKEEKPFNLERFITNLHELPDCPLE